MNNITAETYEPQDEIDVKVLTETIKSKEDNSIAGKLSEVTLDITYVDKDDSVILNLIDNSMLIIFKRSDGYRLVFSDSSRYLNNDTAKTLMSYDRMMYVLNVAAEEIKLKCPR